MQQVQFYPYGTHLVVSVDNAKKFYAIKCKEDVGTLHILIIGINDSIIFSPLPALFDMATNRWNEIGEFEVNIKAKIVLDKELKCNISLGKGVYSVYRMPRGDFIFLLHNSSTVWKRSRE